MYFNSTRVRASHLAKLELSLNDKGKLKKEESFEKQFKNQDMK